MLIRKTCTRSTVAGNCGKSKIRNLFRCMYVVEIFNYYLIKLNCEEIYLEYLNYENLDLCDTNKINNCALKIF